MMHLGTFSIASVNPNSSPADTDLTVLMEERYVVCRIYILPEWILPVQDPLWTINENRRNSHVAIHHFPKDREACVALKNAFHTQRCL